MIFKFIVLLWNCSVTFWGLQLLILNSKGSLFLGPLGILLILASVCFVVNVACFVYHATLALSKFKRHLRHKKGEVTSLNLKKTASYQADSRTVTVSIKR